MPLSSACSFDDPETVCDTTACVLDHARATDEDAYDAVMIPVEEIEGPVHVLTGAEDSLWEAAAYSEMALYRLVSNDHDHTFGDYSYPDAGHLFLRPYYPNMRGGTLEGNARAARRSWLRVLDALEASTEA